MMQLECIISYMHKRYDLFDDDGQGMLPPAFHVTFLVPHLISCCSSMAVVHLES